MIISFSGLDGTGKTTYASFTASYLKSKGYKCEYLHITRGSFYHFILHKVIGKFSKKSQESLELGLRGKKNIYYFMVTSFIKKILLVFNLVYFNIRYFSYKANLKKNIISDRYFYDDLVQMQYLKLSGNFFLSIFKNLSIKPDIIFYLKTEPSIAFVRKLEYTKDYFFNKAYLYNAIFSTINCIEINNGNIKNNSACIHKELDRVFKK